MHDDDKTTYKIKADYDYVDGTLEINIPDIIAELSEEDRKALAELHTFDSAMWEVIKNSLRNELTSEGFNSILHKLRIELLSGDGADPILKKTVRGILFNLDSAKREAKYYRDNYFRMYRWCGDNLSHDQRHDMPKEIKREKATSITNEDVEKAIAEAQEE